MLPRLILLFTLVPIVEVMVLLWIKDRIDWPMTIAIVLLTGVVGAWLARREGFRTLRTIQEELGAGRPPTGAIVDGLLILIAGAVLITPGVLTDLFGFALLVPPIRRMIRRRLVEKFKAHVTVVHSVDHVTRGDDGFVDVPGTGFDADEAAPDETPPDPHARAERRSDSRAGNTLPRDDRGQ